MLAREQTKRTFSKTQNQVEDSVERQAGANGEILWRETGILINAERSCERRHPQQMFTLGKISRIFALSWLRDVGVCQEAESASLLRRWKCNFRELSIDSVAVAERNNYAGVELRHGANVAGKFN